MGIEIDKKRIIENRITHEEIADDFKSLVEIYGEPKDLSQFNIMLLEAVVSGTKSALKLAILKILEHAYIYSNPRDGFVYTYTKLGYMELSRTTYARQQDSKIVQQIGEKYFNILPSLPVRNGCSIADVF